MTSADLLFACIRYSVCGLEMREEEKKAIDERGLKELYALSARHDLAHLVCDALQKNDLFPEDQVGQAFRRQKDLAVYRYIQQSAAFEEICRIFEEAKIVYVPLKGAVIRNFYPEPWMRTSCDIDILVHEEDLERSFFLLTSRLGYRVEGEPGFHHASLYSPTGVHFELHFQIKEGVGLMDSVLGQVWENVAPVLGKSFHYALTNEFFLFYHLAHMAYHFARGGCGIRPFVDCFLLKEKQQCDWQRLWNLTERGGIRRFSEAAFSYGSAWLSYNSYQQDPQMDSIVLNYVLSGGVYGTMENSIRAQQAGKRGTARNIVNRIWMPYELLQRSYGVPGGRKCLLPFYQIKRWCILVFRRNRLRHGVAEIMQNMAVSDNERTEAKQILDYLGFTVT